MDDAPQGPGLQANQKRVDPVSTVAIVFAVPGLMPTGWIRLGNFEGFGPIPFPVLLSIVGMLFGLLTLIRHGELQNPLALRIGIAAVVLGFVRIFLYPLFGW